MIQANELRIGNWLEFNLYGSKWIGQIDHTDFEFIFDNDLRCANPIPLTEEWLVKLGFEKVKNKIDIYEIGRLRIWSGSRGRYLAYLIEEDTTFGHYIPVPIEYVHELQNLFFALCKQELTIKN